MKVMKLALVMFLSLVAASAKVVVLTDDNFEHLTQASTGQTTTGKWFVKFYASWCGHCKSLSPKWEELSDLLEEHASTSGVVIAKLDAVANPETRERFGVTGYPTLLYFADGQVYKYQGPRQLEDLKDFCLEGFKTKEGKSVAPPPSFVVQQRKKFRKLVEEKKQLKMLMDDFEHIVNLRKNAAVVLIVMGVFFGMLFGYILGSRQGSSIKSCKQKSD